MPITLHLSLVSYYTYLFFFPVVKWPRGPSPEEMADRVAAAEAARVERGVRISAFKNAMAATKSATKPRTTEEPLNLEVVFARSMEEARTEMRRGLGLRRRTTVGSP